MPARTPVIQNNEQQPVSIIICAKDEAANLSRNLPQVLAQIYSLPDGNHQYEVVVVNDCSTDNTHQVLQHLQQQYPHLREVVINPETPRNVVGKKFALSTGVAHAANDWLLLTDADCTPAGNSWLAHMVAPLAQGRQIVAGYAGHIATGGLLNKFIRWETTHTFLQLATYAIAGRPYLAIGRNLACTRQVCIKAFQSPDWPIGPTGDDDLMVRESATAHNVAIVTDAAAHTYSTARESVGGWRKQKQRHTSDGKNYKTAIKALLAAYGISQAAVWVYFLYLMFTPWLVPAALILAGRSIIYWILWAAVARRLKEKNIIYLLPIFDIGWMLYNFAFLPYILQKNKQHWT